MSRKHFEIDTNFEAIKVIWVVNETSVVRLQSIMIKD